MWVFRDAVPVNKALREEARGAVNWTDAPWGTNEIPSLCSEPYYLTPATLNLLGIVAIP